MPSLNIIKESNIIRTPRVAQIEGMFDVAPSERSQESWKVEFDLPDDWNIGVIVGPSGSGKTTLAKELFNGHLINSWDWPGDKSILDGFPSELSIKDITAVLSSVGFSSPHLGCAPLPS